ncbi:MAG TPA: GAF domain-containing protein [Chloroflexota bacterium]
MSQEAARLQTLNEIGRVMAATLDLPTLYETIYQQIGRVMDTSQFFLALACETEGVIAVPYLREEGALLLDQTMPAAGSLTAVIIQQGQTIRFDSTAEYEEVARHHDLAGSLVGTQDSESGIFVPLHTGSRTIGALSVQSTQPAAYSADDVQMLSVLASQAAVAIENARLYAHSEQTVRQMQVLLRVAQTINGSLELPTVLDAILTSMRAVIPYYFAALLLPDPIQSYLTVTETVGGPSRGYGQGMTIPVGAGVTGTVFHSGEPLIVNDVSSFAGYIDHGIRAVRAEMAVPLRRGDSIIGVLDVERDDTTGFSREELDLLSLFASQAAIALENARLFAAQQRRVVELQTIQTIVQTLTPLHDRSAIARVVQAELRNLLDYAHCGIFVLEEGSTRLLPVLFEGAEFPYTHVNFGEGLTGWVAQHGRSALVTDSTEDCRVASLPGSPEQVESLLCAPLLSEGQVRGVLTLTKLGSDQFDENALRLLEIIAAQTAIAFDRARLYAVLHTEARTDPLTQLANRRSLIERLEQECSRARRSGEDVACLMLDIDTFKAVNDRFGHDAGDQVLRELARLLRRELRAEDLIARYGGEEFCVLATDLGQEEAVRLGERIRRLVVTSVLPAEVGVRRITVSVGISLFRIGDRGEELVTRADQALYQVKARGGNAVCLALPTGFQLLDPDDEVADSDAG